MTGESLRIWVGRKKDNNVYQPTEGGASWDTGITELVSGT